VEARLKNPVMLMPGALQALLALDKSTEAGEVPYVTRKLIHLRASQINACSVCVDMHARELKKAGEKDERIFAVAAWRETPYFTAPERPSARRSRWRKPRRVWPTARMRCRTMSGTRPPATMTTRRSPLW